MRKIYLMYAAMILSLASFAQLRLTTVAGSVPLGYNSDGGVAEITAYDKVTQQLYVINGNANTIVVYDFSNPSINPIPTVTSIVIAGSGSINSIACYNGLLAAVYENQANRQNNGFVQLYTTTGNTMIGAPIEVGAQPDMIIFTPQGDKLLVANEGEPNNDYTQDPEGSVSIIDVTNPTAPTVQNVSLTSLNGSIPHLSTQPTQMPTIRIFGMKNSLSVTDPLFAADNVKTPSTVAEDLEPEYITISPDGNTAWVSCQENNAILVINIPSASVTTIFGLGYKDHNLAGNGMDISRTPTNTNAVSIRTWPLKGMYQPDGLSVVSIGGIPYIFSANEGDARAWRGLNEELDVNAAFFNRVNLTANPAFSASTIASITAAGIRITNTMGNLNGGNSFMVNSFPGVLNSIAGASFNLGNNFEEIYTYGTRSFSIWNGLTGQLVWDSGDQLEQITYRQFPLNFNADHNGGSANNVRRRSTTKGPEPEAVVTAKIGDSTYAFIALERIGGVMVYNVSNPTMPYFRQYINPRNFSLAPNAGNNPNIGDLGPEGMTIVKEDESADGNAYLIVSNEVSGTIRSYLLDYTQNVVKSKVEPFYIASNKAESDVQAITLSGTDFVSPLTFNTAPAFRFSTNSVTGFTNFDDITFSGSSFNFVLYVKFVGASSGNTSISITDDNGKKATSINVTGIKITTVNGAPAYSLQVLHASDFEAGLAALDNAPRFTAIWNKFNGEYANTLRISGGDNFLPSPFFNASADASFQNTHIEINKAAFGVTLPSLSPTSWPLPGRADINIMNLLDLHASAVGNHEFDAGTGNFADLIRVTYNSDTDPTQMRWFGTRFPYLSSNLDYSGDANLNPLYTPEIRSTDSFKAIATTNFTFEQRKKLAPAAVVTIGGEVIGLVGATTQIVEKISSTGGVQVRSTDIDDMPLLASQIQPVVNQMRSMGINKIVLVSHLQQIAFEKALAPLLSGVDIIVSAGSHTLMADSDDNTEGDTKVENYPFVATDKDGVNTLIVSTESEYKYVGRLVVDFDANGNVLPSSIVTSISGAWKATDNGMARANVNTVTAFSGTSPAYFVKGLIEGINVSPSQPNAITISGVSATTPGIRGIINSQDGNILGKTNVFIEGRRELVRTEETTLGNLSADANIAEAKKLYPNQIILSLKNGGGIRAAIGVVSAVGGNASLLPPASNPGAGKVSGDVSQLDVLNSLRFNNSLSVGDISATNILAVLNHGVRASATGATPGQFAQVGGLRFSWNPSLPAGSRVRSVAVVDDMGKVLDVIAENGAIVGDPNRTYKMVTLSFLVSNGGAGTAGGDSYPLNTATFTNRIDLSASLTVNGFNTATGAALIGTVGGEQDAFAKFFKTNYSTTGYNVAETPASQDLRIQNTSLRSEVVLPEFSIPSVTFTGLVNSNVSTSTLPLSTNRLGAELTVSVPANVTVNGMIGSAMVSSTGGNLNLSISMPTVAGVTTFVITVSAANVVKTFAQTLQATNPVVPSITFTGSTLTVGGASLDLSTVLLSNSSGTKSFTINGSAASLSGSNLVPVSAGTVTVTGSVATIIGYNSGSAMAVFTIVSVPAIIPSITFTGSTLTVGGAGLDLSTVLLSNSSGTKSFSINGSAASLSGNNLVPVSAGTVTVTGFVASTTGFLAASQTAVFNIVSNSGGVVCPAVFILPTDVVITVGGTYLLNESLTGFTLSNPTLASVSGNVLTALAEGTLTVTVTVPSVCFPEETVNVTIVGKGALSVSEFESNTLYVYPNPVTGNVLYLSSSVNGSIVNAMGVEVKRLEKVAEVNVADLPKGLYFLKAGNAKIKFVIE